MKRRLTICLPDELHEHLRQEALRARLSMAELIRLRLEGCASGIRKRGHVADPLLKVAGVCSGPQLSKPIDEELFGI